MPPMPRSFGSAQFSSMPMRSQPGPGGPFRPVNFGNAAGSNTAIPNVMQNNHAPQNSGAGNGGRNWIPQPGDRVMPAGVDQTGPPPLQYSAFGPRHSAAWNGYAGIPSFEPKPEPEPSMWDRIGGWKDKVFRNPFRSKPEPKPQPEAEFGNWMTANMGSPTSSTTMPSTWRTQLASHEQSNGSQIQPNLNGQMSTPPPGLPPGLVSPNGATRNGPLGPAPGYGPQPYLGSYRSGYPGATPHGLVPANPAMGQFGPPNGYPPTFASPTFAPQGSMPLMGHDLGAPPGVMPYSMPGDVGSPPGASPADCQTSGIWTFSTLPDGLVYKPYLAGPRESRVAGSFLNETSQGWLWEGVVGGRVGLMRYGTCGGIFPEGLQLDLEAAVFPRLNLEERWELESADFQFGLPVTWAPQGRPFQFKFGFYHFGSHLGDDFIRRTGIVVPSRTYTRDAFNLGISIQLTESIRSYMESSFAIQTEGPAEPWQFQFGLDYTPMTGFSKAGSPFFGINGLLREEVDFGGGLTVMTGWQWRGRDTDNRLRLGLHYFNGKSNQHSFWNEHEELIGLGLWYDY